VISARLNPPQIARRMGGRTSCSYYNATKAQENLSDGQMGLPSTRTPGNGPARTVFFTTSTFRSVTRNGDTPSPIHKPQKHSGTELRK
jgi:hypothetical protein